MTETERENRSQSRSATELTGMQIRPAQSKDAAALADLASSTFGEAFGSSLEPDDLALELQTRRSPEYFARALETTTILVAEDRGDLVGYVPFGSVDMAEVRPDEGDRGLRRLYVDRRAQGHGLGRRLLEAALTHPDLAAAQCVYLSVWEENTRALRLYESVGFKRCGLTTYSIGGKEIGEDLILCLDRGARAG